MREILFRGKTFDGEWEEGSLHIEYGETTADGKRNLDYRILGMRGECRYVDPETIGQYTGLCDKYGKKIFEGDIIKTHYANAVKCEFVETVVFHNGKFCGENNLAGGGKAWAALWDGVPRFSFDKTVYMDEVEVIGNIHDNPELLNGVS